MDEAEQLRRLEEQLARRLAAIPSHSHKEINARKHDLGGELKARFYFYDQRMFIVSAVSWLAEVGQPAVLPAEVDDTALGKCVCDHLAMYETIPHDNTRNKVSDWGAFRVSGARSARTFEERSFMLSAETMNSAILIEARPRLSLHTELAVCGSGDASHENLGNVIRRTLTAAMELRKAGII